MEAIIRQQQTFIINCHGAKTLSRELCIFSKPFEPQSTDLLPRETIFHHLDHFQARHAVWIHGPAGAGKTAAMVGYLQARKTPYMWYQADVMDARIGVFFENLAPLADELALKHGIELPAYDDQTVDSLPVFCRNYFSQFFDLINDPIAMVFDNLHEVDENSDLYTALHIACHIAPEHIGFYFLSRLAPHKKFTRFLLSNKLGLIHWQALRFSPEETRVLAATVDRDAVVAGELVDEIHQRTDGWAALVRMWLQQFTMGLENPESCCKSIPKVILLYLEAEIFDALSEEDQRFLMATAILPFISPKMAQSAGDFSNLNETMSRLCKKQVLISHPSPNYQYHQLFREFLLQKAQEATGPKAANDMSRKAIGSFLNQGRYGEALEVINSTEHPQSSIRTIVTQVIDRLFEGDFEAWATALTTLSENDRDADPWLMLIHAISRMKLDTSMCKRLLERTYDAFEQSQSETGKLICLTGLFEATLTEGWDDPGPIDTLLNKVPEIDLQRVDPQITTMAEARLLKSVLIAITLRCPTPNELKKWEQRALAGIRNNARPKERSQIAFGLAWKNLLLGEAAVAKGFFDIACDSAKNENDTLPRAVAHKVWEAFYLWGEGRFDQGYAAGGEGLKLLDKKAGVSVLYYLDCIRIGCDLGSQQLKRARRMLKKLSKHVKSNDPVKSAVYNLLQSWAALNEGQVDVAIDHSQSAYQHAVDAGLPIFVALTQAVLALAHGLAGNLDQAQRNLVCAMAKSRKIGAKQIQYLCYLIDAEIQLGDKNQQTALEAVEKAYALGRREEYANTWLWRPEAMTRLCLKALEAGIETQYVQDLIRRRRLNPPNGYGDTRHWPWPIRIQTLNQFSVTVDEEEIGLFGRIKVPILLLKALIVKGIGGKPILVNDILPELWPDCNNVKAMNTFKTNLHRLRKILGYEDAVLVHKKKISLNPLICWVDIWEFDALLKEAEKSWKSAMVSGASKQQAIHLTQKVLMRLTSILLPELNDAWVIYYRNELKKRYLFILKQLCAHYESLSEWTMAIEAYNKGLSIYADEEDLYQCLMNCYNSAGLRSEAIGVFRFCSVMMTSNLGKPPSDKTKGIFKQALS
jgi:DNA-binding SARP family transcriptional activator